MCVARKGLASACGPHRTGVGRGKEREREKRGRGQANEKGGEERREATKTMRRKLDGVKEKAQKEGEGASEREWVSEREREREVANAVSLPSHPAQRERSNA